MGTKKLPLIIFISLAFIALLPFISSASFGYNSIETTVISVTSSGTGTADGSAYVNCTGIEVLLGNGSCQASSDFAGVVDTNESIRFSALVNTDCGGTDKVTGVDDNGNLVCDTDLNTGGNATWNESYADTIYAGIGSGNATWNESWANTLYTNQTYVDAQNVIFNNSLASFVIYVNSTMANFGVYLNSTAGSYALYLNTTMAGYVDAQIAGVSGGNATWNQSYADTIYADIGLGALLQTNITDLNTSVTNRLTVYNNSMEGFCIATNATAGTYADYLNTTAGAYTDQQIAGVGGDNVTWNQTWANTLYTNQTYVDAQDVIFNDSLASYVLYFNTTSASYTIYVNATAGTYTDYMNTTIADYVDAQIAGVADTNESARFGELVGNCSAGQQVFGVDADGKTVCVSDATGAGGKDSGNPYLYNNSVTIYFNETIQNNSIDNRAGVFNDSMATFVIDVNATAGSYVLYVNGTCSSYALYLNTTAGDYTDAQIAGVADTNESIRVQNLYNNWTNFTLDTFTQYNSTWDESTFVLDVNATAGSYTDAQIAGVSGGNATWNESYADTIYADIGLGALLQTNITDLNTSVTNRLTVYNDSIASYVLYFNTTAASYTVYVNGTAGTYALYLNTTMASYVDTQIAGVSGANATWNQSYADTIYADIGLGALLQTNITDLNSSATNRFTVYNNSIASFVVDVNATAGSYTDYMNTTAAGFCIATNATAGTYSDYMNTTIAGYVNKQTADKNMTYHNITNTQCIVFDSGGSICSG